MKALSDIQAALEGLYQVETEVDVRDFLIDDETRRTIGVLRAPREQLLLREIDGELEIALYVDPGALDNLQANDPQVVGLSDRNLEDFCLVLEGVSHFIYTIARARAGLPISALELELQAEVDKYAACVLAEQPRALRQLGSSERIRERLFQDIELCADLDDEERDRYRTANHHASRFARRLERRYVREGRISQMIDELRRFWRLSGSGKLDHIAKAA